LFTVALKGAVVTSAEDRCDVTQLARQASLRDSQLVMLTSSSYVFRVFMLIYFQPSLQTREHFARRSRTTAAELNDHMFMDAICEAGNMCCGAFNRDLGRLFPHVGLSTPNVLDARCATNLAMLKAGHVQHFQVDVNQTTLFHASLCVCDYTDLDFSVDWLHTVDDGASSGELELF
jgi:hypothetical protein